MNVNEQAFEQFQRQISLHELTNQRDRDDIFFTTITNSTPSPLPTPEKTRNVKSNRASLLASTISGISSVPFELHGSDTRTSLSMSIDDYGFQDIELDDIGSFGQTADSKFAIPEMPEMDENNPFSVNPVMDLNVPAPKRSKRKRVPCLNCNTDLQLSRNDIMLSLDRLREEYKSYWKKESSKRTMKRAKLNYNNFLSTSDYFIDDKFLVEYYRSTLAPFLPISPPKSEKQAELENNQPFYEDDFGFNTVEQPHVFQDGTSSTVNSAPLNLPWTSPGLKGKL
jgi:hypothetical protein